MGRIVVHGRNYETNIKKKKGPAEAKKAKITAKHLSKIVMALKKGPAEESLNNELSRSIKAALKDNVPRATIDTRIKKALESSEDVEELEMQGYGNGGFPVIVQCLTENTNRTRTAVREAFKDCNAKVGLDGCVDHMFNKCAVIKFEGADEETIFEASMEAEVEDCVAVEDGVEVIALPQNLHSTLDVLEKQGFEASSSGVEFRPLEEKKLSKEGTYDALRLQHFLNEIDDVTDVHIAGELEDDVELNFNHYGKPLAYGKKGM